MKKLGPDLDEKTLEAYLEKPQEMVKGSQLAFAGLKDPKDLKTSSPVCRR